MLPTNHDKHRKKEKAIIAFMLAVFLFLAGAVIYLGFLAIKA